MAQDRLARLLKQQEMKRTSANQSMEKIKMEREIFEEEQAKAQVGKAEQWANPLVPGKVTKENGAHAQCRSLSSFFQGAAAENGERCAEYENKIAQLKAQHQQEMETARNELKDLYKQVRRTKKRRCCAACQRC